MKAPFLSITGITVPGIAFITLLATGSAVGGPRRKSDRC